MLVYARSEVDLGIAESRFDPEVVRCRNKYLCQRTSALSSALTFDQIMPKGTRAYMMCPY